MFLKPSVGTDAAFKDLTFLQNMITYKTLLKQLLKEHSKSLRNSNVSGVKKLVFALFSDYSELTNKNKKKLMEKVYRKQFASRSDEFRRGIPGCSRAITIDHATELHDMI